MDLATIKEAVKYLCIRNMAFNFPQKQSVVNTNHSWKIRVLHNLHRFHLRICAADRFPSYTQIMILQLLDGSNMKPQRWGNPLKRRNYYVRKTDMHLIKQDINAVYD